MNGLNLPTDNLYKFAALGGITVFLVCIYLMATRAEHGSERRNQLERASALLDEEENLIELEFERLKDKVGARAKFLQDARSEIKKRKVLMYEDAQAATRLLQFNLGIIKELRIWSFAGICIAVFGFWFWYFRVQKYLDIVLKQQANESLVKSPSPSPAPSEQKSDEAVTGLA